MSNELMDFLLEVPKPGEYELKQFLREKGIKETSELTRAIRSIRNDKRLSLREKDGEEWAATLQFANNNGYI